MESTLLIVDDDPDGLTAIGSILDGLGYHLETAASGPEALERAAAVTSDLILLDLMMPGMDGFEVCRRVRATPRLAEVPVVILTALDDRTTLLQGIDAGADDFLTKPIDRQELIARVHNITSLNRYRTLSDQRETLRQMAERVAIAQEQERQHISRELHDDLGQALTAHTLSLRNLQRDLPLDIDQLRQRLDGLAAETNDTLGRMRQLAQDLRPPLLDTLGLPAAVRTHCQEFSQRTQLPVQVEIDPGLALLSDLYAIVLYRVLQEALTNIYKHAHASQVWVELMPDNNSVSLTIQDDGSGFPVDQHLSSGIGLAGLRERLELVGGNLVIRSKHGHGTILLASLPDREITHSKKEGN